MKTITRTTLNIALAAAGVAWAAHAAAQVTFYEREGFVGRHFTTARQVGNFERFGFNDRASSVVVDRGRWEVCEDRRFEGRCVVLRPGRYPSLGAMGLDDRVSSVRGVSGNARVDDARYAPAPRADYRRRSGERVFEAEVTSVRAVLGTSGQRCWVEREALPRERHEADVPAAIAGAVMGNILGYGRDDRNVRSVQRCESAPSQGRPEHWDVTYRFRGREHHVQMTRPPGTIVMVNAQGEPRA